MLHVISAMNSNSCCNVANLCLCLSEFGRFLRDSANKRQDAYGGTIEKRCRFVLETIAAISATIGEHRTAIRFSPFGIFQSMDDTNPVALYSYLFQQLSQIHPNLAYVHLTDFGSTPEAGELMGQLRKEWSGKYILNLSELTPAQAIQHIENDRADLIAFGRHFIANPDLPHRLKNNLPLNEQDVSTFYTHDAAGYIDYSFYNGRHESE